MDRCNKSSSWSEELASWTNFLFFKWKRNTGTREVCTMQQHMTLRLGSTLNVIDCVVRCGSCILINQVNKVKVAANWWCVRSRCSSRGLKSRGTLSSKRRMLLQRWPLWRVHAPDILVTIKSSTGSSGSHRKKAALLVYHYIIMTLFSLAWWRRHGGSFLHSFVDSSPNDSDQRNWADATHSASVNTVVKTKVKFWLHDVFYRSLIVSK
jgi:hypothetical protein